VFLSKLQGLRSVHLGLWLVCGDFNLIYRAANKNNSRLNRILMLVFRSALNLMELTELHLQGRLVMWSNKQDHPHTLQNLSCISCTAWCDLYPNHVLCALSTAASDHTPLLLHYDIAVSGKPRFRFETFWPRFSGYLDAVAHGWQDVPGNANADAFRSLDFKLRSTAKELKRRSQKFVGSVRFQLVVAK
jgi:hypothetical protein